ncbi:kinase [uncultured Muribaculum sp.]|uniref:kinase n=1 Tax=uncultured Muribaculum sp. TaxID=1918613 RepID=UPI0027305474|nr:kinase [uncultured Muribaculum sp.]
MEYYNNKMCVTFDELVSNDGGEAVISRASLSKMLYRNPNLRVSRGGGLDRYARIDYYALRECYRRRYEAKYGDPEEKMKLMRLQEELKVKMDDTARKWYEEYRYTKDGDEKSLTDKLIKEYTINASVLNRLSEIMTQRAACRASRGGSTTNMWATVVDTYERMRDAYGHTLPGSMERLRAKMADYKRDGYAALVSKKIGNSNTTIINEEAGRLLIALKRSAIPVYNDSQIFEEYNRRAEAKGWKKLRSVRSVVEYFKRPDIEPLWYDAVHGELEAHKRYSRKNMTMMPTMRDSLWYGDGTKLNLYYKDYVKGKGWVVKTTSVYEVIDAYSEVLLGYHISDNEDYEAQYNAYRMAVQVSGHKPYELVHDNQGGHKKIGPFLDRIPSHVHRPTAPYSGQSKTIENLFGRFQAQILHKDWRFTGQNITAKKSTSRPNLERIDANKDKLYTLEELKEAYSKARREWNEGLHHETGISRMEMYNSSVNPDTQVVTEYDMEDMFWIMHDRMSTYTDMGIVITVDKREHRYEVQSAPGKPDRNFLENNRGRRFRVMYDPSDMLSVKLYTQDADGSMRFAAIAGPYIKIHRAKQEQTSEDAKFIKANIDANTRARVERQIAARCIEMEHGVTPEQQGLNRSKMIAMPKQKDYQAEIDRETARRMRKYSETVENLSPGKRGKEISNMLWDEIKNNGKVNINISVAERKLG